MIEDTATLEDLELVDHAREGDDQAFVELWSRHYSATLAAARRIARQSRDAEELASDAFAKMLQAIKDGGGPTGSVRAYLLTSVRNQATSRARLASSKDILTDHSTDLDARDAPSKDPVAHQAELSLMREAFATLPRRWQIVLWRTAVDHDSNIEVGRELGLSANAVAALARRARLGLRSAYVQAHASRNVVKPDCRRYVPGLAELLSSSNAPADLVAHVDSGDDCTARLRELTHVDRNLAGILPLALLGLSAQVTGAAAVAGSALDPMAAATAKVGSLAGSKVPIVIAGATVTLAGIATLATLFGPGGAGERGSPRVSIVTTASGVAEISVGADLPDGASGTSLTMTVPPGVRLEGSTGGWSDCSQDAVTVTCLPTLQQGGTAHGIIRLELPTATDGPVTVTIQYTLTDGRTATQSTSVII